jgi:uncharacterized protein (TIGR04168 family)
MNLRKIAVIGDVHDQWEEEDNLALHYLGIDLALFVGDFGNESVDIVRLVAALDLPKAVVLGNHDAWYSASSWGRQRAPYDHNCEDRVQQQLDLLGVSHVGYGCLEVPQCQLAVVGGRPFTWGGSEWKNGHFLSSRYKASNFTESTELIVANVRNTACETIIFLGHNGPKGLGAAPDDICGRDWQITGEDHGDPDLAEAICLTQNLGKIVPLVAFGHMHHDLRHDKNRWRKMVVRDDRGTVYLNAARVPRIIEREGQKRRNFSLISLVEGEVAHIDLVWLAGNSPNFEIVDRELLYRSSSIDMGGEKVQ